MNWGAPYWKFLHGLAEKIGSKPLTKIQEADERRWVLLLLQKVGISMPCQVCRKHYKEWRLARPIRVADKESVRRWLYDLHSNVNSRKGINVQPTLEELESLYKGVNVRDELASIPVQSPEMKDVRRIAVMLFSLWGV